MHKRQGLFLDALLLRQQLSEFLPELQVAREEQEQEQEQEQRWRVGSAQACPWTRNVCKCCASLLAGGSIGAAERAQTKCRLLFTYKKNRLEESTNLHTNISH